MSDEKVLTKEALLGFLADHEAFDLTEYCKGDDKVANQCKDWFWAIISDEDEDYEYPGPPGLIHYDPESMGAMLHSYVLEEINRAAANCFDMNALSSGEEEGDFVFSLDGSTYIVEPGEYFHETVGGIVRTLEEKHPAVRFVASYPYLCAIRSDSEEGQVNLLKELNRVTGFKKFKGDEISEFSWGIGG